MGALGNKPGKAAHAPRKPPQHRIPSPQMVDVSLMARAVLIVLITHKRTESAFAKRRVCPATSMIPTCLDVTCFISQARKGLPARHGNRPGSEMGDTKEARFAYGTAAKVQLKSALKFLSDKSEDVQPRNANSAFPCLGALWACCQSQGHVCRGPCASRFRDCRLLPIFPVGLAAMSASCATPHTSKCLPCAMTPSRPTWPP
jgi:hypothetical protein